MWKEDRGTPIRVSAADRAKALAQVEAMAAQGLIRGDDELQARRQQIIDAMYPDEIRAALINLPAALKPTDFPASDADRQDAKRQIGLHESVGHLTSDEASARIRIIDNCRTRDSLAAVLADLPEIRRPQTGHRISQGERDNAVGQIHDAYFDGRLTKTEHDLAVAQVERARTRQELNLAFRGLTKPSLTSARQKAAVATRASGRVAAEGGRRAAVAFVRWLVAVVVGLVGIVMLVLGYYVVGGVLLAAGVVIWGTSIAALFASRKR
jgi:Domain of unknown function (DUF1707)